MRRSPALTQSSPDNTIQRPSRVRNYRPKELRPGAKKEFQKSQEFCRGGRGMDVGGEQSQNEAENEASWVPMTPQKPNLGGNMQFASSRASASTSGDESFTHWESANNARMSNKKLYFETMNRWKGFSCQELLFQAEAGTIMPSPTQSSEPKCQIPNPHHHSYDLNLSPEATFSILQGKSIPKFAPLTPDKSTRVDNSDVDTRDCDTEKQKNQTTTAMEIVSEPDNDGQSPRPATESSLMVDSTKLQEKQNSDKGDGQVIDLNKTPQQKQRRKKHRPKVITERKPRTPKPKTPNLADSKKNTAGKRQYVRKNRNEIASETPPEVAGQFSDSKTRTPRKRSCKRTLNFEEKQPEDEDSTYSSSKVNLEVNLEWQVPNFCTSNVSKSTIQVCSSIEEVLARNKEAGAIHHETAGTVMLDKDRPPFPMSPNDSNCSTSVSLTQGQEHAKVPMGNYHHVLKVADSGSVNMNGALYNSLHEYEVSWLNNKKRRTDKGQNNTTQSIIFCSTTKDRCRVSAASGQAGKGLQENLQTNKYIFMPLSPDERPTKKRSIRAHKWVSLTSMAGREMGISHPKKLHDANNNGERVENSSGISSCIHALIAQTRETLARKSRTKKRNSPAVQNPTLCGDQQFYSKFAGPSTTMLSVDAIDRQLKCLDINRESSVPYHERNAIVPFSIRYQEQNALILYRREGTVVPYAGSFDPIKKPRPRPKVDLDDETNRVWKLLLENINSEGIDGTDEEKAKWWEEERNVFRGRADSFIARMHLVQGDRRFSQWKGSVLDSVVGVFLTQNVSDHLSSSAFMSLAARFPLKSRNHDKACVVSDEPEVRISESAPNQPVCDRTSFIVLDTEHNEITGASECYMEQDGKAITGLVSLQNSVDSTTSQSCDKSGSCSGSNSDTEDVPNRSEDHCCLRKDESSTLLEVYQRREQMPSNEKLKDDCNDNNATEHENERQNIDKASPRTYLESSMDPASSNCMHEATNEDALIIESFKVFKEDTQSSDISQIRTENSASDQSTLTVESASQKIIQEKMTVTLQETERCPNVLCNNIQVEQNIHTESQNSLIENPVNFEALTQEKNIGIEQKVPNHSDETQAVMKKTESDFDYCGQSLSKECSEMEAATEKSKGKRVRKEKKDRNWDELRKQAEANGRRERTAKTMDSLDWEAVRCAELEEIADTIKERGMNNKLAERIKDFLNRLLREHGNTDLEWLRDVPPDEAKEYLLSIRGLGLKSVECVRLLTLHHLAFPVDTNVGRIAVRLGWVPLQPLPESLQLHLLELYPVLESIQKYLWPRLCKLDQRTLYELHYQMITFGKVFCTKSKPNCNACPMRGECRHFASAFASARLALPGPEEKSVVISTNKGNEDTNFTDMNEKTPLSLPQATKQSEEERSLEAHHQSEAIVGTSYCEPIIEEPATPEPECANTLGDIEDFFSEDPNEIPTIKLNIEEFTQNVQNYMQRNMALQDAEMSKALVALGPEAASIPMPKLKNVSRLRTEHQVYELPDSHPLLDMLRLENREPDDPSHYLLAIWTPGETPESTEPPERCCSQGLDKLCNEEGCFSCNSIREANSQKVRGTVLIPCRTAMRGSFPLNGTYFQVNEMFADHDSSLQPIDVPRAWLWNLPRRTVYFGTSVPTIFRGLTTQEIQQCFWRGYVCVRGFDQKTRAPRPLIARLHFPASKGKRTRDPKNDE